MNSHITISGLEIPFWNLVWLLVKLAFAAIPAAIIIWFLVVVFYAFGAGLLAAAASL